MERSADEKMIDETTVCLKSPDRCEQVWRWPGERFSESNVASRIRFGGRIINVFGGKCCKGVVIC